MPTLKRKSIGTSEMSIDWKRRSTCIRHGRDIDTFGIRLECVGKGRDAFSC
jgi:hypothetical protein